MQTEKLYYQDPYRQEFAATVLGKAALAGGRFAVILDLLRAYVASGGQDMAVACDLLGGG